MSFNSIAALQTAMMAELSKAVQSASKEIKDAMTEEVQQFYSGGTPVMYQRTGKLGQTPKTTSVETGANSASFKAYLDTSGGYPSITYTYWDGNQTTSKAPSMTDVLNLTNYGTTSSSVGVLHPALGSGGYWERSLARMQEILDKNINKYCK